MSVCWIHNIDPTFPLKAGMVFGVIQIIYCLLIVAVNAFLIISMYATKQSFRTTSNFLVLCLSVSDCLIGATIMPLRGFHNIYYDAERMCNTITTSKTMEIFMGGTSISMTMLLAIDRYLHMNSNFHVSPSFISRFFNPPKIYFLAITTSAYFAGASAAFYFVTKSGRKPVFYFSISVVTTLTLAATLFIVVYIRGYLRIRRFVAENPIYSNRERSGSHERPEYLNKLFKTVLLILIAMFVSWIPNILLKLVLTIYYKDEKRFASSHTFAAFWEISFLLNYSNSLVNALIILYRNDKSKAWLASNTCSCHKEAEVTKETDTGEGGRSSAVVINDRRVELAEC